MSGLNFSAPILTINDVPIAHLPGTLNIDFGHPTHNVRALDDGAGGVQNVETVNREESTGMISFEMAATNDAFENQRIWSDATNGVTIRVADSDPNNRFAAATFTRMFMISRRSFTSGSDSSVSFEFSGNVAV